LLAQVNEPALLFEQKLINTLLVNLLPARSFVRYSQGQNAKMNE